MILSKKQIDLIKSEGEQLGLKILYKDICFCLLLKSMESIDIAYQCLFGKIDDTNIASKYNESKHIKWLKERISTEYKKIVVEGGGITNEENAAGLEEILKEAEDAYNKKEITFERKAQIQIQARSKLASLNGTKMRIDEKYIHVNTKYNTICPHCNKEYTRKLN